MSESSGLRFEEVAFAFWGKFRTLGNEPSLGLLLRFD